MTAIARAFDRVLSGAIAAGSAIGAIAIAVLLASSVIEIVMRKIGRPTPWSYDVNIFGLLILVFLTLAAVERHGEHMIVDIVLTRASPRLRRAMNAATRLAALLFALLLSYYGSRVALESLEYGRTIGGQVKIPAFALELLLPVGMLLLALELLRGLVRMARGEDPVLSDDPLTQP